MTPSSVWSISICSHQFYSSFGKAWNDASQYHARYELYVERGVYYAAQTAWTHNYNEEIYAIASAFQMRFADLTNDPTALLLIAVVALQ